MNANQKLGPNALMRESSTTTKTSERTRSLINICVFSSICLLIIQLSASFSTGNPRPTLGVLFLLTGFSISYGLLRWGLLSLLSIWLPLLLWLVLSYLILMNGKSLQASSIPALVIITTMAAVLGGRKHVYSFLALSLITLIVAYVGEVNGFVVNNTGKDSTFPELLTKSFMMIMLTFVVWIFVKDLKDDEQELREAQLLLDLLESRMSNTVIAILDSNLNFAYAGVSTARLLKYPIEEIIGEPVTRFCDTSTSVLYETLADAIRSGKKLTEHHHVKYHFDSSGTLESLNIEGVLIDKDNNYINILSDVLIERSSSTSQYSFLCLVTKPFASLKDIESERSHFEVRRRESVSRLGESISHQINNLIQPVKGYAHLLSESESLNQRETDWLDNIIVCSGQISDLVYDIVHAGTSASSFIRKPIDAVSCIKTTISEIESDTTEPISLVVHHTLPQILVPMSSKDLGSLTKHLVYNAIDSMKDGGVIDIHIGMQDHIVDEEIGKTSCLHFSVKDVGCGIDEGILSNIFDPYFTTKKFTGRGLGLAVALSIAKVYGGTLDVDTNGKEGTKFTLIVPISKLDRELTPSIEI